MVRLLSCHLEVLDFDMRKLIHNFLAYLIGMMFLGGCSEKQSSPPSKRSYSYSEELTEEEDATEDEMNGKDKKEESSTSEKQAPKDSYEEHGLIRIEKVKVIVPSEVKIEDSTMIQGVDVPMLDIRKQNADFVQILRCAASYELKTATGESIEQVKMRFNAKDALKSAWDKAWNDRNSCKIVGEYIIAGKYPDLAANTGDFYYVINPCITKDHSVTRRNECSYQLVTTDTVQYEAKIEKELRDKARELSVAEADLNGLIGEIMFIIEKFKVNLKACEDLIAHERKMLAFKKGLLQLGFFIAGAAIGSIIGPNAAIMVGQMASGIGSQLVATTILGWPHTIANTCLDPNFAGTAEGKSGIQSVTPLYNRLIELLTKDIPQATERLKKVQEEMSVLYKNVITYDEMVASASAKGIDLLSQDQTTGLPAGIPGMGGGGLAPESE